MFCHLCYRGTRSEDVVTCYCHLCYRGTRSEDVVTCSVTVTCVTEEPGVRMLLHVTVTVTCVTEEPGVRMLSLVLSLSLVLQRNQE